MGRWFAPAERHILFSFARSLRFKLCALASSREKKKSPHPLVRACPDDYREGVAQLGLQIDFLKSNSIWNRKSDFLINCLEYQGFDSPLKGGWGDLLLLFGSCGDIFPNPFPHLLALLAAFFDGSHVMDAPIKTADGRFGCRLREGVKLPNRKAIGYLGAVYDV